MIAVDILIALDKPKKEGLFPKGLLSSLFFLHGAASNACSFTFATLLKSAFNCRFNMLAYLFPNHTNFALKITISKSYLRGLGVAIMPISSQKDLALGETFLGLSVI